METYDQMMMPQVPTQMAPIQMGSYQTESIASMRWESDPLIVELRISLGGYVPAATADGQTKLVRPQHVKPMVNDLGIDRFVAVVRGVINPAVALSNLDDEEANTLIRQILIACLDGIEQNWQDFEIRKGDKRFIMSVLKPLVFSQVKRSVGGHEAKNFRTSTVEQSIQQSMQGGQRPSSVMNPFAWGRQK